MRKFTVGLELCKQPELIFEEPYSLALCNAVAQEKGQKEAWELARKIMLDPDEGGYSTDDLRAIFKKSTMGYSMCAQIINENTYDEAIQKVQAWEEEKKAIHVGDIVLDTNGNKSVVTRVGGSTCTTLHADGFIGLYTQAELIKTGKTVDISAMLDQIKEA